ncbi:MAG: hypothetical protein GC157_09235 [Frankiales bacterium]|nr:hypothetical protein [Frankiales bacterium]
MSWTAPPSASGCRDGHPERLTPGYDPQLGLVPSRTSMWFGAVVLALLCAAVWVWLPGLRGWLVVVLAAALGLTALVQLLLGHRGRCAARRTARWFLGAPGALLDPSGDD